MTQMEGKFFWSRLQGYSELMRHIDRIKKKKKKKKFENFSADKNLYRVGFRKCDQAYFKGMFVIL